MKKKLKDYINNKIQNKNVSEVDEQRQIFKKLVESIKNPI